MAPDFLAVGHVTRDIVPGGYTAGGAATYSSLTALRMGLAPAVVTSAASDVDLGSDLAGVEVSVTASNETTTFENLYSGGRRRQRLRATADGLDDSHLPNHWRSTPLVLLGPLVGEIAGSLVRSLAGSTVMASLQGWLRRWDDEGIVSPAPWSGSEVLPHVDAAICSVEDFEDRSLVDAWRQMVPVLIVTMGKDGAMLHRSGRWHFVEPFEAREVDPTGAGDVFAAAYLIRYRETADELESARFASCVASFCVEAPGTSGIPTRAQVDFRIGSSRRARP